MRSLRWLSMWLTLGWGYALTIIVLCLIPLSHPLPLTFHWFDKVEHLSAYALLMGWFVLLLNDPPLLRRHALSFIAMGLGIECLQGLTDYRSFEWADWGSDALGVVIGYGLAYTAPAQGLVWFEHRLNPARPGNPSAP